jgi:DNA-binding GntR family transcriptional regulator
MDHQFPSSLVTSIDEAAAGELALTGSQLLESRQLVELLSIIGESDNIVGARTLTRELNRAGFVLSESTVSRDLRLLDSSGFTTSFGRRGRGLSPKGRALLGGLQSERRLRRTFEEAFDVRHVQDLQDLLAARRTVEAGVARFAARRATPEAIARLRALLDQPETVAGTPRHSSVPQTEPLEFHRVLGEVCGNRVLIALSASVFDHRLDPLEEIHDLVSLMTGSHDRSLAEHRAVLDAVASRDEDEAVRLLDEHLLRLSREVDDFVDSSPPNSLDRLVAAIGSPE